MKDAWFVALDTRKTDTIPGKMDTILLPSWFHVVRKNVKMSYLVFFFSFADPMHTNLIHNNVLIEQDWIMVQVSAFLALRDKSCFRQTCKVVWCDGLCWGDYQMLEQRIIRSFVCTRYGSFQDTLLAYHEAQSEHDYLERRGYTMDYSCMMDAHERHVKATMHFKSALHRMCRLIGCRRNHINSEFIHKRQDVIAKYNRYIDADLLSSDYIESHLHFMISDFHFHCRSE